MGTGKTAQALRSAERGDKTLVFCPKSVKSVWKDEAAKWCPWMSVDIESGFRKPFANEVVVCAYSEVPDERSLDKRTLKTFLDVRAFVDEAQAIKNPHAQVTRNVRAITDRCKRVILMTGTPMVGDPDDLWGLLLAGKLNERCFPSNAEREGWDEYRELCQGELKTVWRSVKTSEGVKRIPSGERMIWGATSTTVHERLKRVMLRRTKAEVMPELPQKRYQTLYVPAPDDITDFLDNVKEEWDFLDADALPPITLLSEARLAISRSRVPHAIDFCESHASFEAPILVFSNYVQPCEAIGRLPGSASITGDTKDTAQIVRDFQAGKYRILAMTIQTGGAGLTLTRAQTVLFVDLNWTPGLNEQAEDRASRKGQTGSVLVVDMVSEHPVDLHVHELLRVKKKNIARAIDGKEIEG